MESDLFDIDFLADDEEMARAERAEEHVESRGGAERCLCCGRYRYGDTMSKYGYCLVPCRNPNEY